MTIRYQTRVYLHGLFAALIGGAANGFLVMGIDPKTFNLFDGGAVKLFTLIILSGLGAGAIYLKEHPLPDPVKDIDAVSASRSKVDDLTKAME
jgi:hypothetical protein